MGSTGMKEHRLIENSRHIKKMLRSIGSSICKVITAENVHLSFFAFFVSLSPLFSLYLQFLSSLQQWN